MKKVFLVIGVIILLCIGLIALTPSYNKDYLLTESFDIDITAYASDDQIDYSDGIIELSDVEKSNPLYLHFFQNEADYYVNNGPFWGPFGHKVYDQEPIYAYSLAEKYAGDGRIQWVLYIVDEKKMIFLFASGSGG